IGMTHEFPAVGLCFLRDAGIVLADTRIDRERRLDVVALEQVEEPPDADPHAVFVPAPVRHVRKQRLSGRRRQDLPRHRLADVPDFEIDDAPEDETLVVRQLERRAIDDRRKCSALARQHRATRLFSDTSFHGSSPGSEWRYKTTSRYGGLGQFWR